MLFDFAQTYIQESLDRAAFENGTLFKFSNKYTARRYVGEQDPKTTLSITQQLSSLCKAALGSVLDYPVMKGEGLENKSILILYPQNSDTPCAFNVAFFWDLHGTPCIHYGLFIVHPDHQGKGIQSVMGFTNLLLLLKRQSGKTVWFTDFGRSPSGSRHFCSFMSHVYPRPGLDDDDGVIEKKYSSQLAVARAFHSRFKSHAGMSPNSELCGMAVRGSNGKGGAEALVRVNGTTRSRNARFNQWMESICPQPEDEVIMVGQFLVTSFLSRELRRRVWAIATFAALITVIFIFTLYRRQET